MHYATADIHGRFDKYQALLEEIHFSQADTLYVLGDDGGRIVRTDSWIDIDCGCGSGGLLGCLCLDALGEFYA